MQRLKDMLTSLDPDVRESLGDRAGGQPRRPSRTFGGARHIGRPAQAVVGVRRTKAH